MRRLDFLIAGVQKSGTTALSTFLTRHSQILFPPIKELHFFDDERVDWARPDYTSLHAHFARRHGQEKLGEATPIYTYWRPSAERIHRYNPAIRLIVLLRHPVERAYSHWAMEVARNSDNSSFAVAIREGRRRVGENVEVPGCHRVFSYVERGFYAEQVERLLVLFPPDQLLFLRTEDLWQRHAETLREVYKFLGVDRHAKLPKREFVSQIQREDLPPMTPEDRTYLMGLYRDDIMRTARLTGLNLSAWVA